MTSERQRKNMMWNEPIALKRECEAVEIPSGIQTKLPAGTLVRVMQNLGTGYTVTSERGYMHRIDAKDADALGIANTVPAQEAAAGGGKFSEELVWQQLKTVYDPEIPVNIADLGLIYSCVSLPLEHGGYSVNVKMSMTAPGCGMGNVLKADVEGKLARLPEVKEVNVEVVFDPPWNPGRMSEAARLQLGFDV
jgi:probable FeS assembly SUF system protein SufT